MNVTYKQRDILLSSLKEHPEIIRGRVSRKSESRKELKDIWEDIANKLNSSGEGPVKTVQEWMKSWSDWKMYVLKKETNRRRNAQGTGGGPPKSVNFTDLEEQLLEILTPEAAGMANIPQAGFQSKKGNNVPHQEVPGHEKILQENEIINDIEIVDVNETLSNENSIEKMPVIYCKDVEFGNSTAYTQYDNRFEVNDDKENSSCGSTKKRKAGLLQNSFSKVISCNDPLTTTADSCDNKFTKCGSLNKKKLKVDCSYNRLEIKQVKKKNEEKESLVLPEKIKSLNEISNLMVHVQEQTLELNRKELQVRQDTLLIQESILQELKEMKKLLQLRQ